MKLNFTNRDFNETDIIRVLDFLYGMNKYPNSASKPNELIHYSVNLTNNQMNRLFSFLFDYAIPTLNFFINREISLRMEDSSLMSKEPVMTPEDSLLMSNILSILKNEDPELKSLMESVMNKNVLSIYKNEPNIT